MFRTKLQETTAHSAPLHLLSPFPSTQAHSFEPRPISAHSVGPKIHAQPRPKLRPIFLLFSQPTFAGSSLFFCKPNLSNQGPFPAGQPACTFGPATGPAPYTQAQAGCFSLLSRVKAPQATMLLFPLFAPRQAMPCRFDFTHAL